MRFRTIRIDSEVWAELEKRISRFGDNPNRVLRREFGLEEEASEDEEDEMDTTDGRTLRLLGLAGFSADDPMPRTKQGTKIISKSGKTLGFVYPQKSRLKVEVPKGRAEGAGLDSWDHERAKGWFNYDTSVYWDVPDEDDTAYQSVGAILARLREEQP